jgi:hypothetical protein
MGQFDSIGLKPIAQIGLSESDRGRGLPERDRENRPGTTYVAKKKDKPKTAAAGSPPPKNPPKNPPKGPTGPKNNDKYNDKNNSNGKKTGYLDKGKK